MPERDVWFAIENICKRLEALEQNQITPKQAADDWQAGHDQDFPAVFEAEERARAILYARENGLALTIEYIYRLENVAHAAYQAWRNTKDSNEHLKAVWEALAPIDFLGEKL